MLTQEQRHNMIESFKQTNGKETAMALAESLFSNDLATKEDLKELRKVIDSQFWKLASLVVLLFSIGIAARIFGCHSWRCDRRVEALLDTVP